MPAQNIIEFQALGPNRPEYISIAKNLANELELAGLKIDIPDLSSEAKWSSVIVAINDPVPISSLEILINKIMQQQDKESLPKTDIAILYRNTNTFYDLPNQWQSFIECFKETTEIDV